MKAFAAAAFALVLSALTTPASALPPAGIALEPLLAANVRAQEADLAAAPTAADRADRYFAADLAVTLGALTLAGGALAALGLARRRREAALLRPAAPNRDWEPAVLQAIEAELAEFAFEYRRAA